jgi:oligoribonuclease (3'-5' exoribonuclease)
MRYVCGDLETTGLDRDKCQIIEMAFVIRDTNNMDEPLESSPAFHCYVKQDWYGGEPFALALNARILEQLGRHQDGKSVDAPVYNESEAIIAFKEFLKENGYKESKNSKRVHFVACGKNFANFDYQFLRRMDGWDKNFNVSSRMLDPAMLWMEPKDNRVPGLKTCLERHGIKKEISHHALEDVFDTIITLEGGLKKLWETQTV